MQDQQAPQTMESKTMTQERRLEWCPQEQAVLGACRCGRPATHLIRWEVDGKGRARTTEAPPRLMCRKCWLAEMEGPVFDAWLWEEEQLAAAAPPLR